MSRRSAVLVLSAAAIFGLGVLARPTVAYVASEAMARLKPKRVDAAPYDALRYARKRSQFEALPAPQKIVFLGDSRFEEGLWSELLDRCDIANRGIEGDTTRGIAERLAASVPTARTTCLIQAGINDLSKGAPLDAVMANYRCILDYLVTEKQSRVVVTSVILAGSDFGKLNAKIAELNGALSQLAASRGVVFADVNHALCPAGSLAAEYSNDGVHPNGRGYVQLSTVLRPLLEPPP